MAVSLGAFGKVPTRSQRILLRFLNSNLKIDINCEIESYKSDISEYLMVGIALIKKYLPYLNDDPIELMQKSWQVHLYLYDTIKIN